MVDTHWLHLITLIDVNLFIYYIVRIVNFETGKCKGIAKTVP
jgi:hypothetical protein